MKKVLIALIFFCSCVYDPPRKSIEVINQTDSAIYIYYSLDDSIDLSRKLVLFESILNDGIETIYSPDYRVNAHSIGGIGTTGRESLVNESNDRRLRLFFIKEKTMREKKWEDICDKHLYEKKMTLSVQELKSCNWVVKYH